MERLVPLHGPHLRHLARRFTSRQRSSAISPRGRVGMSFGWRTRCSLKNGGIAICGPADPDAGAIDGAAMNDDPIVEEVRRGIPHEARALLTSRRRCPDRDGSTARIHPHSAELPCRRLCPASHPTAGERVLIPAPDCGRVRRATGRVAGAGSRSGPRSLHIGGHGLCRKHVIFTRQHLRLRRRSPPASRRPIRRWDWGTRGTRRA